MAHIKTIFIVFFMYFGGFFGSIWAHMGSYGPVWAHMRPARAFENREKFKNIYIFYVTHFSKKSSFLTSRQCFLMEKRVLQVSGRNTFENAYKITSKSKFSTHFVQIPYHLHPARQGVHPALSKSLSELFSCFLHVVYFR